MAIIKEWFCPAHSTFENETGICPHGCTVAEREFRTPPAYHAGKTRRTDEMLRSQVEAFGLSNIKTNVREGETVRMQSESERRIAAMQDKMKRMGRPDLAKTWGAMPKGGTQNFQTGQVENADRGQGAVAAMQTMHAEPTAALETTGVKGAKPAYQYVRDPQNLQVAGKAKAA